ncbi:suppressor of fused domain protein [Butyricicoccus pullicaecorum]|uniref:suppressor of fused domain protein n=1 Tax=Butyricicoccus pullicaecorum TaxID=501571 RepID=UPI003522C737
MDMPETSGWDAITQAMLALYPGQTDPIHYAPVLSYRMGGNDPLDGISIYDGGSYYHFVTYGFSELYEKESQHAAYSGLGFELTLKLKKDGIRKRDKEYKNICGILQTLARMSFEDGDIFSPEEYIYTGQTTGIDADGSSQITGFLTMEDALSTMDTPNGKVQFVQLVGATDAELKALVGGNTTVSALLEKLPDGLTDYTRDSIL